MSVDARVEAAMDMFAASEQVECIEKFHAAEHELSILLKAGACSPAHIALLLHAAVRDIGILYFSRLSFYFGVTDNSEWGESLNERYYDQFDDEFDDDGHPPSFHTCEKVSFLIFDRVFSHALTALAPFATAEQLGQPLPDGEVERALRAATTPAMMREVIMPDSLFDLAAEAARRDSPDGALNPVLPERREVLLELILGAIMKAESGALGYALDALEQMVRVTRVFRALLAAGAPAGALCHMCEYEFSITHRVWTFWQSLYSPVKDACGCTRVDSWVDGVPRDVLCAKDNEARILVPPCSIIPFDFPCVLRVRDSWLAPELAWRRRAPVLALRSARRRRRVDDAATMTAASH